MPRAVIVHAGAAVLGRLSDEVSREVAVQLGALAARGKV
jgi:hypothetical protein